MSEKKQSFEESMKELEQIAKELESDDLSLDESIKKFEKGMSLSKQCKETLDNAEKKITILINDEEKDFTQSKEE